MQTQNYYDEFKIKSAAISTGWKKIIEQKWIKYYGWEGVQIPDSLWRQEKLLREVDEVFKLKKIGIIKISPYYVYNWHRDDLRGCGINMLLSNSPSHTFFSPINEEMDRFSLEDPYIGPVLELKYKPDTFYLFNTQQPHAVYNFKEPRYLFTCEFQQSKHELTYAKLREWKVNYEKN